jgi:hypothetical protein
MTCSDCRDRLNEYVDGELPVAAARDVAAHLAGCPACRAELASLQALLDRAAALPREVPPVRDLWPELQLALGVERAATAAHDPAQRSPAPATSPTVRLDAWRLLAPLSVAASLAFLGVVAERSLAHRVGGPAWSVAAVAGAPRVNARPVRDEAQFRLGQLLETDATSRARVSVGDIGEVTVEANSRLRLAGVGASNHRLDLQRGTVRALIWAPPRLFFVDTPSATAVDLGCQYTLTVDANGDGELHVLTGYVALEHGDRESIVPMGLKCVTRRRHGPGTPFAADAPDALQAALLRFDFDPATAAASLPQILSLARTADAITLWHLLARTSGAQREMVYDTLARLEPPPAGVTRAGILAGDRAMRFRWAEVLGLGSFATR